MISVYLLLDFRIDSNKFFHCFYYYLSHTGRINALEPRMQSSILNIEDTHMRDKNCNARLVAMVCMALVWAYVVGEHKDINIKPIRILKHVRKAKSLVKYGLEEIAAIFLRPTYTPKFGVFTFLSCS